MERKLVYKSWRIFGERYNRSYVELKIIGESKEHPGLVEREAKGCDTWYNRTYEPWLYYDALFDALTKLKASPWCKAMLLDFHNLEQAMSWLESNLEIQTPYHRDRYESYLTIGL